MNPIVVAKPTAIPNTWTTATWEEFLEISAHPDYEKAKFNYYQGSYYFTMGVGSNHAFDDNFISFLINIYCMVQNIPVKGFSNCSYRKQGVRECQPDISYYVGERTSQSPQGNSVVDLDLVPAPNLTIEISSSSIELDLGRKRLLYEEMQVDEYWVLDVQNIEIIAFQISPNLGSYRIRESQVIKGLNFSLLETALQKSRTSDNSEVSKWFMAQLQK